MNSISLVCDDCTSLLSLSQTESWCTGHGCSLFSLNRIIMFNNRMNSVLKMVQQSDRLPLVFVLILLHSYFNMCVCGLT